MGMRRSRWAAPALAGLGGFVVAEILTGSSRPVLVLTNPALFLGLVALYGCGVVLQHELAVRWNAGWASVLFLGAAYGVIEEGLVARSFFDPNWADLGSLAGYGRVAGVNTMWTVYLVCFHAVFSVTIPLALVTLRFPALGRTPWLSKRGTRWVATGFILTVLIGTTVINPSAGGALGLLGATAAAGCLALLAWTVRRWRIHRTAPDDKSRSWWRSAGTGFAASMAMLFVVYALPDAGAPPPVAVGLLVLVMLAVAASARRIARHPRAPRQVWAMLTGALLPWVLLDIALIGQRPDTTVVAVALIVFLIATGRRLPALAAGPAAPDTPTQPNEINRIR